MSGPSGRQYIRGPKAALAGELPAGTIVGEYRVKRRIAEGGMATVYAGIHPLIHKKVAIKVMRPVDDGDPRAVDRFIREARTVNQIAHPNIVDVFAFGLLPDGRCYLVMDWLDGETLAARMRRGRVPFEDAVDALSQIVEALGAAHDKGIIHRDIKPENIYLVPVRKKHVIAKLLDFGISTLLVDERPPDATGQRHFIGTPKYTSPEQAAGAPGDARSDVYALGVTAFELFVGRAPFDAQETSELLRAHLAELPPAPSTLWPDVPIQLERLLVQMLDKAPGQRPTLAAVAARLSELRAEFVASTTERKQGGDLTEVHAVGGRRRGARQALTTLALTAIGAAGLALWALHVRARATTPDPAAPAALAEPASATIPEQQPSAPPATPTTVAAATQPTGERRGSVSALATPPSMPTRGASDAPRSQQEPAQVAHLQVDVDVPALIRVDGRVVARGRRAALDVAPVAAHQLVVSSPRHRVYRERVVVNANATLELAVRLGATRPSVRHRRLEPPPHSFTPSPPERGDPNYTLNPFAAH